VSYVLDASVALKWVLQEPDSPQAIRLRDEALRGLHEFIAPEHFAVEVAHALTKAHRRGQIAGADVSQMLAEVLQYGPVLLPTLPLLFPATAIAARARIGVHDCLYVALAEREARDLRTADDRLRRNLPGHPIVLLAAMP
jgi:predicted nucleic acid-binding protein